MGDAEMELDRLEQIFGRDNTYVELQNAGLEIQQSVFNSLPGLAAKRGLPLVATGDVHYLDATDAYPHEALLCIQSGDSLKNPNHWKFGANEFYFKTPEEMALDFPGHEDAMRRTLEIADRCNVEIPLGRILLPQFPTPDGRDAFDYLVELCEKGLAKRYDKRRPPELDRAPPVRAQDGPRDGLRRLLPDRRRLHRLREARTASRSGRAAASAAGSLAAYCLGITDIDPMRYGLHVRALPQPGPQGHARHGHRLRGRGSRARDQLRRREVRPRSRGADHHLLDDGRPRRACATPAACSRSRTAPSTGSRR